MLFIIKKTLEQMFRELFLTKITQQINLIFLIILSTDSLSIIILMH